ncbi:hypothetical protein GCM10027277_43010 [Pseudoduganella ginsengisoli]|uniref:Mu transposase C-terminal domain-containing protein n=1 Tax=Pseudoduganella ginsengisoli TaxID=1462440 RepID=UPI001478B656
MITRNDLIEYTGPQRKVFRVLWVDEAGAAAYIFNVLPKAAEAQLARVAMLEADLAAGRARRLTDDPWPLPEQPLRRPAKHLQIRDRAWEVVRDLVAMEPAIYEPRRRGQLVQACMAQHDVSHPTVYRYLRRYWQRGLAADALLPDYANSGARGKIRAVSEGVQRGRPRKAGAPPGVNADTAMRRIFRIAATRWPDSAAPFARRAAYDQMLADFFQQRTIETETMRVQSGVRDQALPTYGQFSYWLEQDGLLAKPQALPPLPADIDPGRPGRPAAAFRLEAIPADVRLVSRADRSQALGRPVIYVATDVFSGMVAGIYVGMDRPIWRHALLALANAAADKQRYCLRFGRDIGAALWPAQHLPGLVFADAALAAGADIEHDNLLNQFQTRCLVAPPHEGHAPGLHAELARRIPLLSGAAKDDGEGDTLRCARMDGVLDLEQFTRLVIDSVLHYNHSNPQGGPTPQQLWTWGAAQRGAALRQFPEDLVRCCLLPVTDAMVTAQGIRVQGSHYECVRALDELWFERAARHGQWPVKVAYDPASLDMVYLLDPRAPMHFHACHLADGSSAHRRLSSMELSLLRAAQQRTYADPVHSVVFEKMVAALAR